MQIQNTINNPKKIGAIDKPRERNNLQIFEMRHIKRSIHEYIPYLDI